MSMDFDVESDGIYSVEKPIIRGRRLSGEHILGMLSSGDAPETILKGYP